jgi:hypothetical protein
MIVPVAGVPEMMRAIVMPETGIVAIDVHRRGAIYRNRLIHNCGRLDGYPGYPYVDIKLDSGSSSAAYGH